MSTAIHTALHAQLESMFAKFDTRIQHTLRARTMFSGGMFTAQNLKEVITKGVDYLQEKKSARMFEMKFSMDDKKVDALRDALREHTDFFVEQNVHIELSNTPRFNIISMNRIRT